MATKPSRRGAHADADVRDLGAEQLRPQPAVGDERAPQRGFVRAARDRAQHQTAALRGQGVDRGAAGERCAVVLGAQLQRSIDLQRR